MKYKINVKKSAAKELETLPKKIVVHITQSIIALADNPRPDGCKKLKGKFGDLWRLRVGDYRIIYNIDDGIYVIDIMKVGHRKDIYE